MKKASSECCEIVDLDNFLGLADIGTHVILEHSELSCKNRAR